MNTEAQRTNTNETWKVANGGTEPVSTIKGKRYQYMWEVSSGKHAYYCFDDDLLLTDGLEQYLPECLSA